MNRLKSFFKDDVGATAIEYGLIAALLGVGIIAALTKIKDAENTKYGKIATELTASGAATK